MRRVDDGVPVIGEEHPGGEQETVFLAHLRQGSGQALTVPFLKPGSELQQVNGHEDVAVIQKRAPQPGHTLNLSGPRPASNTHCPRTHKKPQTLRRRSGAPG
jgi:hypothetical protein